MSRAPLRPSPRAKLRRARRRDLEPLLALEQAVFATDLLSRRSMRHFLTAPTATLIVAEVEKEIAGYALVLCPPRSKLARLYSIAVAPHVGRRGIGSQLLAAAEAAARRRGHQTMRLEVHAGNTRAIARYEKSGYRQFGRHRDYYEDHADALRFEKPLSASAQKSARNSAMVVANKADSRRRIGFDGGQHGWRGRQPGRFQL